jgi:hypothetical protein
MQKRFVRRGVARIYWLPTIANLDLGPTRAEITAGLDVTAWTAEIAGFLVTSGTIPTPDMGSRFTSGIPGETTVEDSSLTFYDDEITEDIEDAFPVNDEGYVYFMRKGDKPGTPTGDVFPARVGSRGANWTTEMTAANVPISFSITAEPQVDRIIPAYAAWAATTVYAIGARVTVSGGTLEATVAGTSGATVPTNPATVGGTVVDGTVTWKRIV